MPRDHPCTSDRQSQIEKKPQYVFRMQKLLEAVLHGQPRIDMRIDTTSAFLFGHFFHGIGSERHRHYADEPDDD